MYNWSVIHGIKRKPHLSVVWNWYHFVAIAILHQPRPTDSADINTRLQLSDTSSIPPMHGGFLLWSHGLDGYRKNDRKRAVVWPWLVLELSTVLALTQLGIRQSDWWRAGIRSTNLHIVVEYRNWPRYLSALEWLVLQSGTAWVVPAVGRPLAAAPAGTTSAVPDYRNWPRYGLRWSGWYCNPEQHELCRPSRGRHNECCSGLQYQPRQRRPYKWSISILPRSQFTKNKGNLRFRRLVPLFVPIGVCVTTHGDGTAGDVTIGMWRHNQQATNHKRNGKPWFSLPK